MILFSHKRKTKTINWLSANYFWRGKYKAAIRRIPSGHANKKGEMRKKHWPLDKLGHLLIEKKERRLFSLLIPIKIIK